MSTARDPKVREKVRRYFPVPSPPRWWLSPLVVALVVGIYFVPQMNLFASEQDPDEVLTESRQQGDDAIEAVVKRIEENPELRDQMAEILGELAKEKADRDALKTREEVQRDAIKRLTDLNKRLDDILNGEKGKTAEAMEQALKQLKSPEEGPAKEFAEALAKGDFKAAQQALQQMMKDAKDGKLNKEQQEQLAQQLNELAKQMQQLAQQQGALQQALQQAGLNPQLAQNPQALQQAIQNAQNLNEQQKQQLQQMAAAQAAAQQMMGQIAQGMQQMAQQMQQGQMAPGQPGQQGLAQQLNQMEMMQQMLQQAQAAANACQGQCQGLGQGLGMQQAMQQWMQQQGGAFGNRGQGRGGKAPMSPTPTGTKIVQSPSKRSPGDIIARQFIDGPLVKGESQAEFRQVASAVADGFDEAQADEQIPPKYRDAHMHYFGELEKRVDAVQRPDDAPSTEPAGDDTAEDDGE